MFKIIEGGKLEKDEKPSNPILCIIEGENNNPEVNQDENISKQVKFSEWLTSEHKQYLIEFLDIIIFLRSKKIGVEENFPIELSNLFKFYLRSFESSFCDLEKILKEENINNLNKVLGYCKLIKKLKENKISYFNIVSGFNLNRRRGLPILLELLQSFQFPDWFKKKYLITLVSSDVENILEVEKR